MKTVQIYVPNSSYFNLHPALNIVISKINI